MKNKTEYEAMLKVEIEEKTKMETMLQSKFVVKRSFQNQRQISQFSASSEFSVVFSIVQLVQCRVWQQQQGESHTTIQPGVARIATDQIL